MRAKFFEKLIEEMRKNKDIFFLMGDTGYGLVEPIFEEFPERSLNVGIAEQNMIGIAAGLANAGFKPVCYAITNFLVFRCLEQIRNDVCLHNYPVILVGTATGFDHGKLWASHYVTDDIGCIKCLPNLNIYSPSGPESIDKIFDEIINSQNPCYVRISKSDFSEEKEIGGINRYIVKNFQSDVLVISHGKMIKNSHIAYKKFPKFSIYAFDKIKPLENKDVKKILKEYKKIVVIEDNFNSGLYNSLCQFLVENKIEEINMYSISPIEEFEERIGDVETLEARYGLSSEKIIEFIKNLI
jgi:transketolase